MILCKIGIVRIREETKLNMIKTFYYSDATGDIYPSVEEAVIAETGKPNKSDRQKGMAEVLEKFEKLRNEYIRQLKLLQNEFEPEFLRLIDIIEKSSDGDQG